MADHRKSYQKTIVAAFAVTAIALLAAGLLLALPLLTQFPTAVGVVAAVVCFGLAAFAAWTASGGMIALRRDVLEARGQPYHSAEPRERSAGPFVRFRRHILSMMSPSRTRLGLRPGEWVQIRPYAEIAATLDEKGDLDGLPFMPEMLRYCGKRVRVMRRIEKTHDYVHHTGLRRMKDAVLLENLRCDGASHGGCQAACQFLWKESWLAPAPGAGPKAIDSAAVQDVQLHVNTTVHEEGVGEVRYRCQMTQFPQATSSLAWGDPRHYWRDIWSGNVRFPLWMTSIALALFNAVQKRRGGSSAPFRTPSGSKTTPTQILELMPGERVRVKSKPEIEKTLNAGSRNRGLWFDVEMHRFCGGEFRVGARVTYMVEEATGRLLKLGNPCIVLDGVSASGEYLGLCPQNELIYWREIWLERTLSRPASA